MVHHATRSNTGFSQTPTRTNFKNGNPHIFYLKNRRTYEKAIPPYLYKGPIGDYFNYYDGTVYYVAYGGENYDYDCCYAMDVETGEQKAILSLSPEMYDAFGDPIGITQVDYRNGNYDADSIPTNEEGWPMALNELVDGLFVVNGQVFARGRLARTGMAEIWVLCDGASGAVWG